MAPRDVGASRSSQCDWRDSRSPPSPAFAHTTIPTTSRFSFTLQRALLSHVTPTTPLRVCTSISLSLSPSHHHSEFTNVYISDLSFSSVYLSHPSHRAPSLFLHPSGSLCVSLSLFLSLFYSLVHPRSSPFLLNRSIYSYRYLSVMHPCYPLLALSCTSPSVPQQPSRHWPGGRSREHRSGQSCAG